MKPAINVDRWIALARQRCTACLPVLLGEETRPCRECLVAVRDELRGADA